MSRSVRDYHGRAGGTKSLAHFSCISRRKLAADRFLFYAPNPCKRLSVQPFQFTSHRTSSCSDVGHEARWPVSNRPIIRPPRLGPRRFPKLRRFRWSLRRGRPAAALIRFASFRAGPIPHRPSRPAGSAFLARAEAVSCRLFPPPRGHPVPLRPSRPASCAPVSVSSDSFRYDSLAPYRAVGPYCASKFPPAGYPGPGLPLTVRPPPMRPPRHCGLQPPDVVRHLPHCRLFPLIDAAVRPDRSRPIRPLSRPSRPDTSDPSRLDTSDPSRLRAGPPAVRLVSSRAPRLDPSES